MCLHCDVCTHDCVCVRVRERERESVFVCEGELIIILGKYHDLNIQTSVLFNIFIDQKRNLYFMQIYAEKEPRKGSIAINEALQIRMKETSQLQ